MNCQKLIKNQKKNIPMNIKNKKKIRSIKQTKKNIKNIMNRKK